MYKYVMHFYDGTELFFDAETEEDAAELAVAEVSRDQELRHKLQVGHFLGHHPIVEESIEAPAEIDINIIFC